MSSYTNLEKIEIFNKHLIKKAIENTGLNYY